jgi:HSP20 family molecular chaperone IbpA
MAEKTVPEETATTAPETREESRTLAPPVDIFEFPEGLAVVVDLPGVDKDGVSVHVENNTLTIKASGSCRAPGDTLYREFSLMNYFRQFQLSEKIDQEKIVADMRQGVLTVRLPKAEAAKPKKIAVKVSD